MVIADERWILVPVSETLDPCNIARVFGHSVGGDRSNLNRRYVALLGNPFLPIFTFFVTLGVLTC